MFTPNIQCLWGLNFNRQFNQKIEILIDRFSMVPIPEDTIRIIVLQEPFYISSYRGLLMNNSFNNLYHHIFTYDEMLLNTHPKATLFLGINTWISKFNLEKKFGVSTLIGGKNSSFLEGYAIRHNVYVKRNEITIPKDIYLSSHSRLPVSYDNELVLGNDKTPMFDNQFHITIENTSMNNMFTEKLIDCFQTKTIPIYYGCPNIGNYFNINGIIHVNSITDIITETNKLTPEYYQTKLEYIEENYEKSMKYVSFDDLLYNKIIEILN